MGWGSRRAAVSTRKNYDSCYKKDDESPQLTAESNNLQKPDQRKLSPSEERLKEIFSPDGFVDQEALDNLRQAKEEGNWKDVAYWSAILVARSTKQGQAAEDAIEFVEDPSLDNLPGGKKNKKRKSKQYHTNFKVHLNEDQYFDSDAKQFRYANKKLIRKLKNDPNYRKRMFKRHPQLKKWMKDSKKHSSSPPGLTWHHDEDPGLLKLVDRRDHSKEHGLYHPEGKGGRELWGGGEAGRIGHLNTDGSIKDQYRNLYE